MYTINQCVARNQQNIRLFFSSTSLAHFV